MTRSENQSTGHIATLGGTPGASESVARMSTLSKRGKLAGFEKGTGEILATFAAFGHPFDGVVEVTTEPDGLRFDLKMPKKMPIIFAVVLAVSVWPGLPLTDAFLQGFGWYERLTSGAFETWMWYLPLAVIPAPFALLTAIKKSRASAFQHATETVERLRSKLSA